MWKQLAVVVVASATTVGCAYGGAIPSETEMHVLPDGGAIVTTVDPEDGGANPTPDSGNAATQPDSGATAPDGGSGAAPDAGSACVAASACTAGKSCGSVTDSCGASQDCGACSDPSNMCEQSSCLSFESLGCLAFPSAQACDMSALGANPASSDAFCVQIGVGVSYIFGCDKSTVLPADRCSPQHYGNGTLIPGWYQCNASGAPQ
jgi:hypothetical protein